MLITFVEGHATSERRSRGEIRRKQSRDGSRVDSRDKSRTKAKTWQSSNRDERRESRAPAETRSVSKQRDKARAKNTSNDSLMLELARRALLYRKSATAAVVLHVESDLHEHANGRCKRSTSSASSSTHFRGSRARLHNARECEHVNNVSHATISVNRVILIINSVNISASGIAASGVAPVKLYPMEWLQ